MSAIADIHSEVEQRIIRYLLIEGKQDPRQIGDKLTCSIMGHTYTDIMTAVWRLVKKDKIEISNGVQLKIKQ